MDCGFRAKKKPRSTKGRRKTSDPVQDSVEGDSVPRKPHRIQAPRDKKLGDKLPPSQPAGQENKPSEPAGEENKAAIPSFSVPAHTAGNEEAARKKGAQPRPLKTKSPRTAPKGRDKGESDLQSLL